jgi:DNA topoisomerase-1
MITYSVVAFRFRRINQFRNGPIARARSKNTETSKSNQGKILVIVESPAKAKTIQKFLPDEYIVDYCAGHIRNLPSSGSILPDEYKKKVISKELNLRANYLGIDVYDNFKPFYVTASGKDDRLQKLINQAKKCSMILLATDEDREGEAISWHLLECLKPTVPHKRAVFREITKNAILDSFNNPREIDMNLVQSQETRRILDRLAGFTLSPVLWRLSMNCCLLWNHIHILYHRYVARGLSAGRVQSCGLHLITQVVS